MLPKLKIFKPQFLLIGFLIIDKFLLIKPLREYFSETPVANPYVETLEDADAAHLKKLANAKISFWNFGTSRSMGFYLFPNQAHSKVDPFTSTKMKEHIKKIEIHNFASPGSNPSIYYTRLIQLLEKGYKPDGILVELSAFSFNQNNRYNSISRLEGISVKFAVTHYDQMAPNYLKDIILSRIFLSYRYKISMNRMKKELGIKDKNKNDTMLQEFQKKSSSIDVFLAEIEKLRIKENKAYTKFDDFNQEKIDQLNKYLKFEFLTEVLEKEFYGNFQIDEDQIFFVGQIIETAIAKKIPIIFWRPKLHPILTNIYSKYNLETLWSKRILSITKKIQFVFII